MGEAAENKQDKEEDEKVMNEEVDEKEDGQSCTLAALH